MSGRAPVSVLARSEPWKRTLLVMAVMACPWRGLAGFRV